MAIIRTKWFRALLIASGLLLILLLFPSWTPKIRDEKGAVVPGSIAIMEEVSLGGIEQTILIRGKDRNNPVVLFLHGGPGYPQISYARKYQQELENEFVVVNWDQRGSGKSYHFGMSREDMETDRLVEDTLELTKYLRQKFNTEKIFIVGHSWGSTLATWTVERQPELFHAYIGVGQVAHSQLGEQLSYQFALEEARRQNNEKATRELIAIGSPPYDNPRKDATLERKWVAAFGGSERGISTYKDLIKGILLAPEYTWLDGVRVLLGDSFSRNAILPQTEQTNLIESVPELKLPVYICMGRYDYMTPSEAAYSYYEQLIAPEKQFIWFEQSAHFPHFEEREKFLALMVGLKEKLVI